VIEAGASGPLHTGVNSNAPCRRVFRLRSRLRPGPRRVLLWHRLNLCPEKQALLLEDWPSWSSFSWRLFPRLACLRWRLRGPSPYGPKSQDGTGVFRLTRGHPPQTLPRSRVELRPVTRRSAASDGPCADDRVARVWRRNSSCAVSFSAVVTWPPGSARAEPGQKHTRGSEVRRQPT